MNEWEVTLVTEAQGGNSKCFEELYALYYKKVFAVIKATVKNSADAEDILQQTFLSAWRSLKNLSNPAAFNTWLQRIAINHCYELLRKKNMAILLDSEDELCSVADIASDEMLPAVYAEQEDLRVRLGRILEGLSEVQRQTVTLFYFNELKVEEIAEVMACSVGTVKTQLFLARKAIRSEIEEQERKSGQKFYGIAGVPLLPLAQVISRQIESASLAPAASDAILGDIASKIAGEAAVAAQTAAGSSSAASTASAAGTGATTAGTATTGMALGVKIIIGIVAAAVVTAGAFLLPRMGENPPDVSDTPAITETQTPAQSVTLPSVEPSDETPDEPEQELDVYLTTEQLAFLEPLETALLAYGMDSAFPILQSPEFQALCRSLPEPDGNTYKYNDSGEWMIACFPQDDGGENFQIAFVTNWDDGNVYLAEAYRRDGAITGGTMMTYDVTAGNVSDAFYNAIDVNVADGNVIINRRDESGEQ
ncbi:MAG: RNA polymerase sigma factor [Clostridiales bacterium]|nr:RNA polymerase sigma factor [Clostridiales bacterium]